MGTGDRQCRDGEVARASLGLRKVEFAWGMSAAARPCLRAAGGGALGPIVQGREEDDICWAGVRSTGRVGRGVTVGVAAGGGL